MPLLKSGGFRANFGPAEANGNTVSVKADDYIGYVTSEYAVAGNSGRGGVVRLKFLAAQETKGGQTVPEASAPALPFELPRRAEHVRLVYLVRVSEADHNMAIVASKRLNSLDAFTSHLRADPRICQTSNEVFCSWVPAGIAVRPEKQ